ncbi:hypothetical protein DSO57_1022338 [Entomophthora muscae]|uniref:Uncharacterized protein n=1 Tax=Entomophthora muscae TaxID=34485 RepID=A0ACC2U1G1_9FUNG|nr:hypothetical protein DSO57_1022338 [Entomophthora muscae]
MLLAFSKSLFKTLPEKFTTNAQKATLQRDDLLKNYNQFSDALLTTVSPAPNSDQLRDQISALYQGRIIKGPLGVKVGENQFNLMESPLSNLAFPLILGFPWAKTAKAVLNLDTMTLSTQKEGITFSVHFDQTRHEGILTSEDTINVLTALKETDQPQIPPSFRTYPKTSVNPPAPSYQIAGNLT